ALKEPFKLSAFRLARVAHDPPGASNVHSTVGDLALWDQNFYDAKIGDPKLLDLMQTKAKLNDGKEIKYADGLMRDRYHGAKSVANTGPEAGYKPVLLGFPDERFSVIVLANVQNFVPIRMAKKVADIYLREKLKPQPMPKEIDVAGDALDSFAGEYRFGQSLW